MIIINAVKDRHYHYSKHCMLLRNTMGPPKNTSAFVLWVSTLIVLIIRIINESEAAKATVKALLQ